MLVIRLSRTGRKKQPYYRVVVAEKSAPIKGRLIEVLGHFNPRTKELVIDVERAKERVKNGAQPSETAEALLEKAGVLKREEITEQNRRPARKAKKEMKSEAESGASSQSSAAEAPADDAKANDKPEAKAEEKSDTKPEDKTGEAPADATEVKADAPAKGEKPEAKAEKKAESKAEVKSDDVKKDDAVTNDDKGDSQ